MGVALVLGLLWFRALGFLKIVNEHLATFIEALKQIFFDIRFFCIVFLVLIFTFGDMLRLIFVSDKDIDCANDSSSAGEDFCAGNAIDSFLRVYAVIIGDFELR